MANSDEMDADTNITLTSSQENFYNFIAVLLSIIGFLLIFTPVALIGIGLLFLGLYIMSEIKWVKRTDMLQDKLDQIINKLD